MFISWIKKLFVKTSPVEPEAVVVEESLPRKPKVQKKRGRPLGSKNKGLSIFHLKRRPHRRADEPASNYTKRLKRWEARNDPAKTKSNQDSH